MEATDPPFGNSIHLVEVLRRSSTQDWQSGTLDHRGYVIHPFVRFPPAIRTAYFIFILNADLTTRQFSHSAEVLYTNETLLQYGFLGATPEKPTLAFSLELLEIYRQLRRVCPRFSLDALAKALCHLHCVCAFFSCLDNV